MHDNNRTATFEKELNHNQESYLLFHRCASTKTSLPRLLQIEIWPPLMSTMWPKPLIYEAAFIHFRNMQKHETVPRVVLFPKNFLILIFFQRNSRSSCQKKVLTFHSLFTNQENQPINNQAMYKFVEFKKKIIWPHCVICRRPHGFATLHRSLILFGEKIVF